MQPQSSDGQIHFQCPVCKLYYAEREWADQCEAWCRDHTSCNIDIIKHAIESKNVKEV